MERMEGTKPQKQVDPTAGQCTQGQSGKPTMGQNNTEPQFTPTTKNVNSHVPLRPNRAEAQRFLDAVAPGGFFSFQTFDDDPERKDCKLIRVLHGTLEQHGSTLCKLNTAGAGIFVTVNKTDLGGRKKGNIICVRAVFADLDGSPLEPVLDGPLRPHMTVESSPDRYHAYWLATPGFPPEEFRPVQQALADKFNGDHKVIDLPRVMRIPGFWHRKKEPFQTQILSIEDFPRYAPKAIRKAFPFTQSKPRKHFLMPAIAGHGEPICEHERNVSLTSEAGRLRKNGHDLQEIRKDLLRINEERCSPPLDEREVEGIAKSVSRYLPGQQMSVMKAQSLVRDVKTTVRSNPAGVFESETLTALAIVRQEAPGEYAEFKQEAKGHVREIEAAIRRQNIHAVSDPALEELRTAGDMISDAPAPGVVIPEPYRLLESATVIEIQGNDGPSFRNIAEAPVLITMRLRDQEEGTEHLQLSWRRADHWESIITDRETALNSRLLVGLAGQGYPVGSDNAGDLAKFHRKLEATNVQQLKIVPQTGHMGWQGKGGKLSFIWGTTLLSGDGEASPVGTVATDDGSDDRAMYLNPKDPGDLQVIRGFHSAGDMESWKRTISALKDHPNALVVFYSSFVPPSLRVLENPGFAVDMSGRTSLGKTTALRGAASVWGRPDESLPDSAMGTWDTTRVHIERRAAIQSDIPICLDDTQLQPQKELINDLIYQVSSGRGKGRGSKRGIATTSTFATVMISTGEAPASSFCEHGGARTRILEVRGMPFGGEGASTLSVVDRLNSQLRLHYGHAGPAFVTWLIKNRNHWGAFRDICRRHTEYFSENTTGAGIRLAGLAGVIATAAELAHLALDLPWDPKTVFSELEQILGRQIHDLDSDMRALRSVVSWAYSRQEAFYGRHDRLARCAVDDPIRPRDGWLGAWSLSADYQFVGFFPHHLETFLKREGYRPDAIQSAWQDRGLLLCEGKHRTRKVVVEKERVRLICVARQAFEDGGD